MTTVAVSDAGPLIHLAEIDSLSLLTVLDELLLPETVFEEVSVGGRPDGLSSLKYTLVEGDTTGEPADDLDPGETAAIAVADKQEAVLLTTIWLRGTERSSWGSTSTVRLASSRSDSLVGVSSGTKLPN